MNAAIVFIIIGYLSGSILFARIAAGLFGKPDVLGNSNDGNPGAANAFRYGGFFCGLLTLFGDLAKGFLPVWVYFRCFCDSDRVLLNAIVLAAPVLGHILPIFFHFSGGKGIAVTFGCLAGLLPVWEPLILLAGFFVLFSTILCITPHLSRTAFSYLSTLVTMFLTGGARSVNIGFFLISTAVFFRLHKSKEERAETRVRLLWMH